MLRVLRRSFQIKFGQFWQQKSGLSAGGFQSFVWAPTTVALVTLLKTKNKRNVCGHKQIAAIVVQLPVAAITYSNRKCVYESFCEFLFFTNFFPHFLFSQTQKTKKKASRTSCSSHKFSKFPKNFELSWVFLSWASLAKASHVLLWHELL